MNECQTGKQRKNEYIWKECYKRERERWKKNIIKEREKERRKERETEEEYYKREREGRRIL